jgi:hypothetical protein
MSHSNTLEINSRKNIRYFEFIFFKPRKMEHLVIAIRVSEFFSKDSDRL